MEHFCVAMRLLEPQANYVLVCPHISHINEQDIWILSNMQTANAKTSLPSM